MAVIVMDMDDVLVDLSSKAYAEIRKQWTFFGHYFVDVGPLTTEQLQNRACYYLNEWLIKKEYENMTSEQYAALQMALAKIMTDSVFANDLYKDSEPTLFAKRTLLNPLYIESNEVKKVYILSRTVGGKIQEESKREFFEKYFKHPKIQFINVKINESKFNILKEKGIEWDLLVDDELSNIRTFAEGYQTLKGKEFLIPRFGYNKMPADLDMLIKGKGGIYTYYNPFDATTFKVGN